MRRVVLTLAALAASAAVASPAFANEARVEARGGVIWGGGNEEATAGIAAGYDFDLGSAAFAGVEVSADKALAGGADIGVGFTGRVGLKASEATKVYVDGGYTVSDGEDTPHVGAGIEQKLGKNLYGKVFYRHNFSDFTDTNTVGIGAGVKF
ncbi:hypothetical protein H0274_03110 [Altererythrobacter sp. CC-YST694]|uniref:outer membrane protein n=1 Tax=Altererythrobacter sp. CC-YST694 TaxID=2755038 RepID=UPI001D01EDF6|nr:hypothetical protein [Altererythrobacter sp. CC-YST694]MCB5424238.1 hypothetical protein [Altererythrobacter sp. CC-YST694]